MITLKKVDLAIQILILVVGITLSVALEYVEIFSIYFALGGWQVASCLIHHFAVPQLRSAKRKSYAWTILITFLITIVTIPIFFFIGIALLLVTPFFAFWYMEICYLEIRALGMRELIHLKRG